MKKIIFFILFLFVLILGYIYYYFTYINLTNDNLVIKNKILKEKNKEKEKKNDSEKSVKVEINGNFRNNDEVLKQLNTDINRLEPGQDKAVASYLRSNFLLAKRDLNDLKQSIDDLKNSYKYSQDNVLKGRSLEKLANMYWRTGGDIRIFNYVFSGEFKKYLDKEKNKDYIVNSIINLYKEAYNINPTPRSSIELAYYYSYLKRYKEAFKWFRVAEKFDNSRKNQHYLYKKWLTEMELYRKSDNKEKVLKEIKKDYLELKELFSAYGEFNYNNENSQSLPFLYMFYAKFLLDNGLDNNKKEINLLLSKVIDYVKNDPDQKNDEFVYFLEIQKNKKNKDLLGSDLVRFAKINSKFKEFLEHYGFSFNK